MKRPGTSVWFAMACSAMARIQGKYCRAETSSVTADLSLNFVFVCRVAQYLAAVIRDRDEAPVVALFDQPVQVLDVLGCLRSPRA